MKGFSLPEEVTDALPILASNRCKSIIRSCVNRYSKSRRCIALARLHVALHINGPE